MSQKSRGSFFWRWKTQDHTGSVLSVREGKWRPQFRKIIRWWILKRFFISFVLVYGSAPLHHWPFRNPFVSRDEGAMYMALSMTSTTLWAWLDFQSSDTRVTSKESHSLCLRITSQISSTKSWYFSGHLETFQTIWKVSRPCRNFLGHPETFQNHLKMCLFSNANNLRWA